MHVQGTQFDREGFLRRQDDDSAREFLAQFMGMQMWDCFIREREDNKDKYTGPFEQRVFMLEKFEASLASAKSVHEADILRKAIAELKHRGLPKEKIKERLKRSKKPNTAATTSLHNDTSAVQISTPMNSMLPAGLALRPKNLPGGAASAVPSHVTATGRRNSAASDIDVIRFVLSGVPLPKKIGPAGAGAGAGAAGAGAADGTSADGFGGSATTADGKRRVALARPRAPRPKSIQ